MLVLGPCWPGTSDQLYYPPQLSDDHLHLFGEGRHHHAHRFLDAQDSGNLA